MQITNFFNPYDGNSTGYSFIYTSKQGGNSTSSQQQAETEPEKQMRTEYDLIAEESVDESVELFKCALRMLSTLNHNVFCRYQHNVLGIARMDPWKKDVLLCNDKDPKKWSSLKSKTCDGNAIIDRNLTKLTLYSYDSGAEIGHEHTFEGIKEHEDSNSDSTPEMIINKNFNFITLGSLQDYVQDTNNLLDTTEENDAESIATTIEILESIANLTTRIFHAKAIEDPEQRAIMYMEIKNDFGCS